MRTLALLLALAVVGPAGCTDSLGIGGECEAEKRTVRLQHGGPDRTEEGVDSEIWFYQNGDSSYYFEFSWAGGTCQVIGPVQFARGPG